MDFNGSRVEKNMINLNVDDIALLKSKKHLVQDALFCPSISAHVNTVPAAKFFRQATPLAAMLCDIKYSVKHLQVSYFHVATRNWQQVSDNFELLRCNFHPAIIQKLV